MKNYCLGEFLTAGILVSIFMTACTTRNPVAPKDAFQQTSVPANNVTIVDDFEDNNTLNELGGSWFVYTDQANGGNSRIFPNPLQVASGSGQGALGSSYYISVTGTVTTQYAYGFVGVGTNLSATPSVALDLSIYQELVFYIKGDGQRYRLSLVSANIHDSDYFGTAIPTSAQWQKIVLPLTASNFVQQGFGAPESFLASLKEVTGFQWQTIGQSMPAIAFSLDQIQLNK